MNFFKQIAIYIWSLWCILIFLLCLILLFPFLYIVVRLGNDKVIRAAHFVPPMAARVCLFLFGIRLKIIHPELIDAQGQYVFISNHRSYLDAFIAGASIPNFLKFLGKGEILHYPVLGYLLKHLYVPVWRQDKTHRAWSMEEMEEKVKTGCSFFICPEGTCNTSKDFFIKFYDGAFRLAAETGIPLVPLTFIGSGEAMPRNRFILIPSTITVYWHAAIPAHEIDLNNLEKIKDRVKDIMKADLLKHYPDGFYSKN